MLDIWTPSLQGNTERSLDFQVTLSPSTSKLAKSVQASDALISALSRNACMPGGCLQNVSLNTRTRLLTVLKRRGDCVLYTVPDFAQYIAVVDK